MIKVTRTIHPVGQGLFCTERFYNDEQQPLFNIVYDCGSYNYAALSDQIKKAFADGATIDAVFISHLHYDHISGLKDLAQQYQIKSVVMPQLSNNLLIEAFVYNCVHAPKLYVDVNQFIYRLISNDNGDFRRIFVERNENEEGFLNEDDIDISTLTGQEKLKSSKIIITHNNSNPIWEYVPYNIVSAADSEALVQALAHNPLFASCFAQDSIDVRRFLEIIGTNEGREKCAEIYKTVIKDYNANEYSMPVYSGPIINDEGVVRVCDSQCYAPYHPHCHMCCDMDSASYPNGGSLANCLYTGDFNAKPEKPYYQDMVKFYHLIHRWERIKMIQVPHHGSEHNHNIDLYQGRCWAFISCGLRNRYHHPHGVCVADIFNTGCHCSIVNEHCQPLKIDIIIH